jgi:polyferredoxin
MDSKPWYASKTILINAATIFALALALPDVIAIIPPGWMPYITAINALLNVSLRIFGNGSGPITLRKDGSQ